MTDLTVLKAALGALEFAASGNVGFQAIPFEVSGKAKAAIPALRDLITRMEASIKCVLCPFCGGWGQRKQKLDADDNVVSETVTCKPCGYTMPMAKWLKRHTPAMREPAVSPYQDYTWEDVAMLVQENRMLKAAKQPVRVDVDKCARNIFTAIWKKSQSYAAQMDWKFGQESYRLYAAAVLSIVKDAAKEMGVELIYDEGAMK